MEIRRSGLNAHKRHIPPETDGVVAVKKKAKSVSVASVFKQQPKKTKNSDTIPQIELTATSPITKDEPARKKNASKFLSSSRSPNKSRSRMSKRPEPDPLLMEFKGVSLVKLKRPTLTRHMYRYK